MPWKFFGLALFLWMASACELIVTFQPAEEDGAQCGDGLDNDGDGAADCADPDCQDEEPCEPNCGNGVIDSGEDCDAENLNGFDCTDLDFDGGELRCSSDCTFDTEGCIELCGNGIIDSEDEECDEGSGNSQEPNAFCRVDCTPARCGDNIVDSLFKESCDDGNNIPGDGCSEFCQLEKEEICGDGFVSFREQCDDGNTINGDGCDQNCFAEVTEIEDNGDFTVANLFVENFIGAINPPDDVDFIIFSVLDIASSSTVEIEVWDTQGPPSCNGIDPTLELFDRDGTTSLLFNDDFNGLCPFISLSGLVPGRYFVAVRSFQGNSTLGYRLFITVTPDSK